MNSKSLSVLIMADHRLHADALLHQMKQGTGIDGFVVTSDEAENAAPERVIGHDLAVLIGDDPARSAAILQEKFFRGPVLHLAREGGRKDQQDIVLLPARYPALIRKIRSLASSYWFRDDLGLEIGSFVLRPAFKELQRPGAAPLSLTDKEVGILIYLYRMGGNIVPRDILLAEIWGYNAEVSTHTLETHIYRLRQKIEMTPDAETLLITEAGGYRLASISAE